MGKYIATSCAALAPFRSGTLVRLRQASSEKSVAAPVLQTRVLICRWWIILLSGYNHKPGGPWYVWNGLTPREYLGGYPYPHW